MYSTCIPYVNVDINVYLCNYITTLCFLFSPFIFEINFLTQDLKEEEEKPRASASISQGREGGGNWRRMRAAEPGSAGAVAVWQLPVSLCFHRERKIKMQLHFSSDAVPDAVCSDFQNLNKFTEQVT